MKKTPIKTIMWFRRDLRLADNPALYEAARNGGVIPLFVLEDATDMVFSPGGASRWWLHHSLSALNKALSKKGAPLILRRGDPREIVPALADETGADAVHWNRRYDFDGIETDKAIKSTLHDQGIEAVSFNGALLREPWEFKTKTGGFYKVYTPFWKTMQANGPGRDDALPAPKKIVPADNIDAIKSDDLADWALLPTTPNWAAEFPDQWRPGEDHAKKALDRFLKTAVDRYGDERNRPDIEGTSRLSPHLAFGEMSPLQIWRTTMARIEAGDVQNGEGMKFLSEVVWREFSHVLLFHYPEIQSKPLKAPFANFPWRDDQETLKKWQTGQTGYPIIDAGMRQLWRTGWMHNRVRMIVGSFLVKNLMIPWQEGERWFWDTLVDADPANNTASWQWVAGCGADAAPYFRIFNPVTHGEKFDPDGTYVRRFVPEIAELPSKHIHAPFNAPLSLLKGANITLGDTYPHPIVDLSETRKRALAAYDDIRAA